MAIGNGGIRVLDVYKVINLNLTAVQKLLGDFDNLRDTRRVKLANRKIARANYGRILAFANKCLHAEQCMVLTVHLLQYIKLARSQCANSALLA